MKYAVVESGFGIVTFQQKNDESTKHGAILHAPFWLVLWLTHEMKSTSVYSHDRVVTAYDMGNYNAVYLGVEAFGHGANQNSVKLLGNSIEWAATGVVQPATVSESSSLSVFMVGLLGLALRRFKTKQGK